MALARRRKFNGTLTVASGSDAGRGRRRTEPLFPWRGTGQERAAKRGFDKSKCVPPSARGRARWCRDGGGEEEERRRK